MNPTGDTTAKIDLIFGVVATAGDWCWSYEAFGGCTPTSLAPIFLKLLLRICLALEPGKLLNKNSIRGRNFLIDEHRGRTEGMLEAAKIQPEFDWVPRNVCCCLAL